MQKYEGAGVVQVNGRTLAEATKITMRAKSNDNPVRTMLKGFDGFSDGPGDCEATIENAIPKKGFEFDFINAVNNKETLTIVCYCGGRRLQSTGRATDAEFSMQTDAVALKTANFLGTKIKSLGG